MAKNNAGSVILAFLTGGLVGAGVALLFAPTSGEESRERIRETSQDLKSQAVLKADHARERATEFTDQARGKIDEAKSSVAAAVDAGKETFQRTKQELLHCHEEEEEA